MGLEALASFVEAAQRGSLTGAARALGVPKSTISRRVSRLEEAVGQALVHRTARTFRLTEAGEALFRRSAPALLDLDEAMRAAQDEAAGPAGELRVTAPIDLGGSAAFTSRVVAFTRAWPQVRLTLDVSDRMVDLVSDGFDVAVRLHTRPLEDRASLRARRLGSVEMGLFATTGYLDRVGRPQQVSDLDRHDLVRIERPGGATPWLALAALPELDASAVLGRGLVSTSLSFCASAVAAGAGIGLIPVFVAAELPGPVERVLPQVEVPAPTLSLVWPLSRHLSPRVRRFVDFLAEGGWPPR